MAAIDDINRAFREFRRYTGDGLPGEPSNAPLPVGDPSSGPHSPKKADIRKTLGTVVTEAGAAVGTAEAAAQAAEEARVGAITAQGAAEEARDLAQQYAEQAGSVAVPDGSLTDAKIKSDAGIKTSKLSHTASGTGAVARTLEAYLNDRPVSVKDFGAKGDGAAADEAAFAAAHAASSTILVPPGTYRITANATWPSGRKWVFANGAQLSVASGVTLTIKGTIEAGAHHIFGGAGTVTGIKDVRPEWWGAVRNGTTSDTLAIQATQKSMEEGIIQGSDGEAIMRLSAGQYAMSTRVLIYPTNVARITWEGQGGGANGTQFVALNPWNGGGASGAAVPVIYIAANANTDSTTLLTMRGFRLVPQTPGAGATHGITIGNQQLYMLQGGAHESCLIEDVGVYEFSVCWFIAKTRLFKFHRCGAWIQTVANGKCVQFTGLGSNAAVGDMDFESCQLVNNASGGRVIDITMAGSNHLAGVRFNSCIMYGGAAHIVATSGGKVSDIWFTGGWQYDVVKGEGFVVGADGAGSSVWDINFVDGYYAGGLVSTFKAWNLYAANSGKLRSVRIQNNFIIQPWGDIIAASLMSGLTIKDNHIVDANGGSFVFVNSCSGVVVSENVAMRKDTANSFAYMFTNNGGGSNYYIVTNNISNGICGTVNDPSPGAQRTVSGNI